MARTPEAITADLAAIEAALTRGARRLRLNGEEVEFDFAQLRSRRAELLAELSGAGPGRFGVSYPRTSRGL